MTSSLKIYFVSVFMVLHSRRKFDPQQRRVRMSGLLWTKDVISQNTSNADWSKSWRRTKTQPTLRTTFKSLFCSPSLSSPLFESVCPKQIQYVCPFLSRTSDLSLAFYGCVCWFVCQSLCLFFVSSWLLLVIVSVIVSLLKPASICASDIFYFTACRSIPRC